MSTGAETKTPLPLSLPEEMFREAIELAHRVNRRVTDTDLQRGDAKPPGTGTKDELRDR